MKPVQLIMIGVAALACAFSFANARSSYGAVITGQYKFEKDSVSSKAGCKYCHISAFGGGGWNKFGIALRTKWDTAAKGKIQDALFLVLGDNADSDKDGYSDLLEVVAKTLPGDAKSKPSASVSELEADLKKIGGVETFKPVVAK
jgi:hypothetical protein